MGLDLRIEFVDWVLLDRCGTGSRMFFMISWFRGLVVCIWGVVIGDRGLGIATREEYLLKKERTKKHKGRVTECLLSCVLCLLDRWMGCRVLVPD